MSETTLSIGELADRAGLPVRTVRFYCDEGLLPVGRSGGGHRRFDPSAVERLRTIRRLRALGLGLAALAGVLDGERSLAEAVAAERAALEVELSALAWRHATLRAVEQAGPAEGAARLDLLAAAGLGAAARDALVGFWRSVIVAPIGGRYLDGFVALAVPDPPADPTPGQVVAYAEMVALAADPTLVRRVRARGRVNARAISDEEALMEGVGEAWRLAVPALAAGAPPAPGAALDRLVAAHAGVRGGRDTPEFRRHLHAELTLDQDPRLDRYWRLAARVTGDRLSLGLTHEWLLASLGVSNRSLRGTGPA
ncbi:MerR family transcriptional regulator [Actinomadura kijaniata]|uniref:MerR family transcriptional regulator n=1 Tax=Actinomadura kijaniata TaxID=46161 RepID=UPI002FE70186